MFLGLVGTICLLDPLFSQQGGQEIGNPDGMTPNLHEAQGCWILGVGSGHPEPDSLPALHVKGLLPYLPLVSQVFSQLRKRLLPL